MFWEVFVVGFDKGDIFVFVVVWSDNEIFMKKVVVF